MLVAERIFLPIAVLLAALGLRLPVPLRYGCRAQSTMARVKFNGSAQVTDFGNSAAPELEAEGIRILTGVGLRRHACAFR